MTIEEKIRNKIAEAAPYYDTLSAVTIIHNITTGAPVYMSRKGLELLRISENDLLSMDVEYYNRFFNAEEAKEYVPKILGLLERNNNDELISFFQQVRTAPNGEWELWLSATRIFMRDDNGNPLLTITNTIPVEPEHNFSSKVERMIGENDFLRRHKHLYASLTKREIEILRLMARDESSAQIAEQLFLSEDTVKTHRKNIKKKIIAENQYDIMRFAQAFDIV